MKSSLSLASVLVVSVTLTSCENRAHLMTQTNPSPTAGFKVRLKIDNAPGPFEIIDVGGQFDVRNSNQCGKVIPAVGLPSKIVKSKDVSLTRVGDDEYEGVIYLDTMQDEDYYGRGVCHWELIRAYAVLIAADEVKDTSFAVSLPVHDLVKGGATTRYFVHADYPRLDEVDGYTAGGKKTPDEFLPEYRAHVFSMTLSSLGAAE